LSFLMCVYVSVCLRIILLSPLCLRTIALAQFIDGYNMSAYLSWSMNCAKAYVFPCVYVGVSACVCVCVRVRVCVRVYVCVCACVPNYIYFTSLNL